MTDPFKTCRQDGNAYHLGYIQILVRLDDRQQRYLPLNIHKYPHLGYNGKNGVYSFLGCLLTSELFKYLNDLLDLR